MNAPRLVALLAIFAAAAPLPARSQPRGPGAQGEDVPFLSYEPVNLAAADSTLARVDVLYRIDTEFFVALTNTDSTIEAPYLRRGEILIELLDSTGTSRKRTIERISIPSPPPDPLRPTRSWHSGRASFEVPQGVYRVLLEVSDLESDRRFTERERTIRALTSAAMGRTTFPPLLLTTVPTETTDTVIPQNYGGDALFGLPGGMAVDLPGSLSGPGTPVLRYSLSAFPLSPDEPPVEIRRDTMTAVRSIPGGLLTPLDSGPDPVYGIAPGRGTGTLALFILPLEQLPLRTFELRGVIEAGGDTIGVHRRFRMVWPDMPSSLRNVELALDALRFITTESILDSLRTGSFAERVDHLEGFWKAKDRTPGTAANEVMTEYYRRVDHARRAFATLREPDGLRTDRGRIYVLHGPPSHSERTLDPENGYREVWTYDQTGRRFVFLDRGRSGVYELQGAGGR